MAFYEDSSFSSNDLDFYISQSQTPLKATTEIYSFDELEKVLRYQKQQFSKKLYVLHEKVSECETTLLQYDRNIQRKFKTIRNSRKTHAKSYQDSLNLIFQRIKYKPIPKNQENILERSFKINKYQSQLQQMESILQKLETEENVKKEKVNFSVLEELRNLDHQLLEEEKNNKSTIETIENELNIFESSMLQRIQQMDQKGSKWMQLCIGQIDNFIQRSEESLNDGLF